MELIALSGEQLKDWALDVPLRIALIAIGTAFVATVVRRAVRSAVRRAAKARVPAGKLSAIGSLGGAERPGPEAAARAARAGQRVDALSAVLSSGLVFVVWVMGIFMILGELGLNLGPLLAGAGVIGLAIGFGAQSLVRDFLAGIFILVEDQFAVGDIVDVGEATGVVEEVTLRITRLRSVEGTVWHVPNGEIVRVGNMSQHWSRSLLDIEVAYDTDLERAKSVIKRVADQLATEDADILDEPDVWGVEVLGASGITIRLVVKTTPSEQWRISRTLRERIKAAFDSEGIEIPFPQQTIWHRAETKSGD